MKQLIFLITLFTSTSLLEANEIIPIWNSSVDGGDIQDMQILKGGEEALLITGLATNSKFIKISTEDGSTIDEYEGSFADYAKFEILPDSLRIVNVNNFNENTIEIRNIEDLKTIDSIRVIRPEGLLAYINNLVVDPVRPIIYVNVTAIDTTNGRFKVSGNVQAYNYDNLSFEKDFTEFIDDEYSALAVSSDGKYLAAVNDGLKAYLKIWDLVTNELVVNKPMFDKNSDEECFTRGLIFSDKEKSMIYISGGYTDFMNDDGERSSIIAYDFKEDIRTSIAADGIYTSGNILFFDDEIRIILNASRTIGLINMDSDLLEWYNKPPDSVYSNLIRYIQSYDTFLSTSKGGNRISKFKYDRETNIDNEYEKEIVISPNPTQSLVNINVECNNSSIIYSIYNTGGMLITDDETENLADSFSIDFTPYPSGVYFLSFMCNNLLKTYKIVKEG
jgi:hypothetical protein